MTITVGRTVYYTLSEQDVQQINRRRLLIKNSTWPAGAQAHVGNHACINDVVPLVVTRVWPHSNIYSINGQAFLDGNDVLWVTSVKEGTEPGTWAWPPRVNN